MIDFSDFQFPDPSTDVILLTQGKKTIIDAEDFERVSAHKWCAIKNSGKWYAKSRMMIEPPNFIAQGLHRFLLNLKPGDRVIVDHENGDGLDNRKCNLRLTNNSGNANNIRVARGETSKFKGVSYHKQFGYWVTCVVMEKGKSPKRIYHRDEITAARCYDEIALKYHGEFACTNVMLGLLPPLTPENSS